MSTVNKDLYKKGLLLEYFTIGYNFIEAIVSIFFGSAVNSVALIGFGLDSIVESASGFILVWRLKKHGTMSKEEEEKIERAATKFVAASFFILAAYVIFQSLKALIANQKPESSLPGIIIAFASVIVMPVLAKQKEKIGKLINSRALIADSKETLACSMLSAALLIGLGANYLFGFWQADPVTGLIISIFLIKEGRENWLGECTCHK
jgi:divalent metal cation (Fe/Co/Zn/Cd) transporter